MVGIFGGATVVMLLLAYLASALAVYIPFNAEQRLAANFAPIPKVNAPLQHYLQQMADRLAKAEQLPPEMSIVVHYVDGDTVNAFATLGGHVVFFRGLLEKMPNENALAMVMAHEIAHVRTRAPLRSLGRGMVIAAALQLVNGSLGTQVAGDVLGQAGLLTQLSFSRTQESEADRVGLRALVKTYGGTAGADDLFRILKQVSGADEKHMTEFYRSHPDISKRLAVLHDLARSEGWSPGDTTPLPAAFSGWLRSRKTKCPPPK